MTAVYHWRAKPPGILQRYERRTTICHAKSRKKAETKLLKEAKNYPIENIVFLHAYMIAKLDRAPCKKPIEVASELTLGVDPKSGTPIKPKKFLRDIWDHGRVSDCKKFGFAHAWYNQDGVRSGCYNCNVVEKGRLWESQS